MPSTQHTQRPNFFGHGVVHQDQVPPVTVCGGTSANCQTQQPTLATVDKWISSVETKGLQELKHFFCQSCISYRTPLLDPNKEHWFSPSYFPAPELQDGFLHAFKSVCLGHGLSECGQCFTPHEWACVCARFLLSYSMSNSLYVSNLPVFSLLCAVSIWVRSLLVYFGHSEAFCTSIGVFSHSMQTRGWWDTGGGWEQEYLPCAIRMGMK